MIYDTPDRSDYMTRCTPGRHHLPRLPWADPICLDCGVDANEELEELGEEGVVAAQAAADAPRPIRVFAPLGPLAADPWTVAS